MFEIKRKEIFIIFSRYVRKAASTNHPDIFLKIFSLWLIIKGTQDNLFPTLCIVIIVL